MSLHSPAYQAHSYACEVTADPMEPASADNCQQPSEWLDPQQVAQLRHESSRLQHLLQVMPAGVVVLDANGIVRQVNQQAIALLGEPLEGQVWRHIISRAFQPRADDGHEVSLKDGRRVKLSITPLVDEPGQLILITDLTETRQLQDKISHMQRLSSLGKMVASLAHQIRTPLSAAMLYANNLASGKLPVQARESFSEKLANRLQELESQVNDMLLFAKSGEHNVVSAIAVHPMLDALKITLAPMLEQFQGELIVQSSEQNGLILGNQTALEGALQNLVHNALQLQGSGAKVTISQTLDSEQGMVRLSVADNGPGIPESIKPRIFEPFFTTKSQGTGLGLAVVKSVVEAHQGRISVSNNEQGGACFHLDLPLQVGE